MPDRSPVALKVPALPNPLDLYVHGERDRVVSRQLREQGIWEPYETALLLSLLAPGDVFVDVGANIGYFSLLAASVVGPCGQVIAFEPDPDNCALLRASARRNELSARIEVVQAGLSDRPGQGRLYLSEDNLGDHQIFAGDEARDSLPVTLHRGTQFLAGRLQRLDLLKVDTQGAEQRVMAGLMPLLRRLPRVPAIILELTPYSLAEAGASGRQLVELLATLSPDMWIIDHIEHRLVATPAEELARWCDNVAATPGDRGFMNILVGRAP